MDNIRLDNSLNLGIYERLNFKMMNKDKLILETLLRHKSFIEQRLKSIKESKDSIELIKIELEERLNPWLKRYLKNKLLFEANGTTYKEVEYKAAKLYKDYLEGRLKDFSGISLLSFKWKKDVQLIEILFDELLEENFIDKITDIENFKLVFSESPTNKIEPVNWIKPQTSLAWMLFSFESRGKESLAFIDLQIAIEKKVARSFLLKNNQIKETSFKSTFDTIKQVGCNKKDKEILDSIFCKLSKR